MNTKFDTNFNLHISSNNIYDNLIEIKAKNTNFDLLCCFWWAVWGFRNKVIFNNENLNNLNNICYETINN